jgi:hypothetical protein
MFRNTFLPFVIFSLLSLPLGAQPAQYKIAVIGLVHSHVWGHLATMVEGKTATLVGVSEPNPELVTEAKKAGVPDNLFYPDYKKMLDEVKPDIVWAFVENNRHLEIAKECLPRHINLIFEKPTASTYADARQIQALAQKYNVRVMTNYQMAWWPSNYVAKDAVDKGDIGTVYRLRRRAQQVLLRLAYRPGKKWSGSIDGLRLLQRPVEHLVSGHAENRLCHRAALAARAFSQSGRRRHAGAHLPERRRHLRRKLEFAAQHAGSGNFRTA